MLRMQSASAQRRLGTAMRICKRCGEHGAAVSRYHAERTACVVCGAVAYAKPRAVDIPGELRGARRGGRKASPPPPFTADMPPSKGRDVATRQLAFALFG